MQSFIHHQILRSQRQNALHVLELYAVNDELLHRLAAERVAGWLLAAVQIDLLDGGLVACFAEGDLDDLLETFVLVDVPEGRYLLLNLLVVVDG